MKIDLDEKFEELMRRVWPAVHPDSRQSRESRKVWYATISWFLSALTEIAELDDDEAEAVLEDFSQQIKEFKRQFEIETKEEQ